jgi:hypothetical protein
MPFSNAYNSICRILHTGFVNFGSRTPEVGIVFHLIFALFTACKLLLLLQAPMPVIAWWFWAFGVGGGWC